MKSALLAVCVTLAGCAYNAYLPDPIVDLPADAKTDKYYSDLMQCRDLAMQVQNNFLSDAFVGALVGAATGATIGAAVGDAGTGAAVGAAVGGPSAGVYSAANSTNKQVQVMVNCMIGRGYRVLGIR